MPVKVVSSLEECKPIVMLCDNGDRPAVFEFWATWCNPCKLISPVFDRLAGQFPNADYYKVDIDEAVDVAEEVGVRALPVFMAFSNGEKIKELTGVNPQGLQVDAFFRILCSSG
ncbi:thioredoxin [Earliella scabrosa]|nr:thioredoxin [Earliella scabrosa]